MWMRIFVLGVGGFIGSNLRYWISQWAIVSLGNTMPFGTLIVNAIGSFILGFITLYGTEVVELDPSLQLLVGTGMMGALTTFSTFSLETLLLFKQSNYSLALLNILLNVVVGLAAVWLGIYTVKVLT